jgi:hypothetical protein
MPELGIQLFSRAHKVKEEVNVILHFHILGSTAWKLHVHVPGIVKASSTCAVSLDINIEYGHLFVQSAIDHLSGSTDGSRVQKCYSTRPHQGIDKKHYAYKLQRQPD